MSDESGYRERTCDECGVGVIVPASWDGFKLCIDCEQDRLKDKFGDDAEQWKPNPRVEP